MIIEGNAVQPFCFFLYKVAAPLKYHFKIFFRNVSPCISECTVNYQCGGLSPVYLNLVI